jgi:hypothetical protein
MKKDTVQTPDNFKFLEKDYEPTNQTYCDFAVDHEGDTRFLSVIVIESGEVSKVLNCENHKISGTYIEQQVEMNKIIEDTCKKYNCKLIK